MAEEDAFLDSIAADHADRTRLLVFADWLADRADPREEFLRLHAQMLEMDGTEPEFQNLDRQWAEWTGGVPLLPGYLPGPNPRRLTDRWIDSLCRLFTAADIGARPPEDAVSWVSNFSRLEFEQMHHTETSGEESLILYRSPASVFRSPLAFVTRTVARDLWVDPFLPGAPPTLTNRVLSPVSRGGFWQRWRAHRAGLRNPPPLPAIAPDNPFLGGQYILGDWNNWAFVAAHRDDYFALFWSTTA